jgi:hypothetical protein
MKPIRGSYAVLTAVPSAAVLVLAMAVPGQAATAGWRATFSHHYGVATNYSGYTAVAVPGPGDAWAFGSTNLAGAPAPGVPVAEHWNGTKWSASPLPSGLHSEINAASVVSASSVWAVTETDGDIAHWNGSKWSVAEAEPGSSGLLSTGITAVSDSNVWAFGCSGLGPGTGTWHFDGHTWTLVTGSAVGLVSASAVSASNIWAIGSTSRGPCGDMLTHYNGTTWQPVTVPALTGLLFSDILALSSTNVWAIAGNGNGGQAQLVHFNGTTWTSVKAPYSGMTLDFFAPDGHGGFWLDGSSRLSKTSVLHYSASGQWSRIGLTSGSMGPIALVPGTRSLWGVGSVATATPASNARIWEYGHAG